MPDKLQRSLDEVARELAEAHREAEPTTLAVYLALDPAGREIRLVEVSGSVGTTGEVLPFRLGPRVDQGIPYPSIVVVLSPDEWKQLEAGQIELPESWGSAAALVPLSKAS